MLQVKTYYSNRDMLISISPNFFIKSIMLSVSDLIPKRKFFRKIYC